MATNRRITRRITDPRFQHWSLPFPAPAAEEADVSTLGWITDRIAFQNVAPVSGSTGEFESWITNRLYFEDHVEAEEEEAATLAAAAVWRPTIASLPDAPPRRARLFVSANDEYLESSTSPVSGPPFTVGLWIYPTQDTANQNLFTIADVASGSDYYALAYRGNDPPGDPVRLSRRAGGSTVSNDTTSGLSSNTWGHVCFVVADVDDVALFLDGGSKGTSATSVDPSTSHIRFADGTGYGLGGGAGEFDGRIALPAIWNCALTDFEVWLLSQGVPPWKIRPESLVGCWLPDGTDISGYAHHMTAYNDPGYAPGPQDIISVMERHSRHRHVLALPGAAEEEGVAGQPMQLRGIHIPHLRQWHPRVAS